MERGAQEHRIRPLGNRKERCISDMPASCRPCAQRTHTAVCFASQLGEQKRTTKARTRVQDIQQSSCCIWQRPCKLIASSTRILMSAMQW
jgi:hypothetical protein